eukprot:3354596-Prymnesium_polylepis.1
MATGHAFHRTSARRARRACDTGRAFSRTSARRAQRACDAHLLVLIEAREEDDGHTEDVVVGDAARVRRLGLEYNFVAAHLHRPDADRVEQLVVLVRLGRADIDELPLDVVVERSDALKLDLKLRGATREGDYACRVEPTAGA